MQLIMEPEPVADVKPITTMVDTEPIIKEKLTKVVEEIKNGIISKEKEASENDLDLNKAWEEINGNSKVVENGDSIGAPVDPQETHEKVEEGKQVASVAENSKDVANVNHHETQNNEPKIDEAKDIISTDNVITPKDKGERVPENANKTDKVFPEHNKQNTEQKNGQTEEILRKDDKISESVERPVTEEVNGVTHENNDIENSIENTDVIAEDVSDTDANSLKLNGDIRKIENIPDDTPIQKEPIESADAVEIKPSNAENPKSPDNDKPSEIEKEQVYETITTEADKVMEEDTYREKNLQSPKSDEADINNTIDMKSANNAQTNSENNKVDVPESTEASIVQTPEVEKATPLAETKPEKPVEMVSGPVHIAESKVESSEAMDVEETASDVLPESDNPSVNSDLVDKSKNVETAENMDVDPVPKSDNTIKGKVLEATDNTEKMEIDLDNMSVIEDEHKTSDIDKLTEEVSQLETIEVAMDTTKSEENKITDVTTESLDETDRKLEDIQPDVTSETKISEIPAEVTERENSDDQNYSVVANEDVNEIMDSDDEKEAEKAKTVKADNNVQEIKDTTEHSKEAKPQKRNFLGLANTLDILSDDEESESNVKEPKKTKISADTDENKCIDLDDEKAPVVTDKAKDDKCTSNTLDILSDDEESEQKVEENKNTEISADADSKCINLDDDKDTTEVTEKAKVDSKCISNTLDILSDDEESEQKVEEQKKTDMSAETDDSKCINLDDDKAPEVTDKSKDDKCISIDDDDDVMLIDEDTPKENAEKGKTPEKEIVKEAENKDIPPEMKKEVDSSKAVDVLSGSENESSSPPKPVVDEKVDINEKPASPPKEKKPVNTKPLIPENFLKKFKANVAEMNRDELEEFCLLKIVEAVIDRSNLSDISSKLKKLSTNVEEWKKKALTLTKQNRDLQIVVNTVQEEHQKRAEGIVTPLKITRSVGMQVVMTETSNDKIAARRKTIQPIQPPPPPQAQTRGGRTYTPRAAKQQPANPPNIPVPRLVPAANNSPLKTTRQVQQIKASPTVAKVTHPVRVEKRSYTSMQSVTVDLTDDEPAPKQPATIPRNNQVRLVSPQQLLTPRAQINTANSPRKVFIPINAPNNLRPGQTIMIKPGGPGPRGPRGSVVRMSQAPVRMGRAPGQRHPAPLPEAPKQPQHNMWKALPPEPDLKISKVENGIVISWKIEGYQEDSYEEIASYQLYAYQETSSPPSTLLWKKIGDVKALPLPMACTLTQFMAGFKYYFAVRAVDVKSRIGPFSLPGSILLLNK